MNRGSRIQCPRRTFSEVTAAGLSRDVKMTASADGLTPSTYQTVIAARTQRRGPGRPPHQRPKQTWWCRHPNQGVMKKPLWKRSRRRHSFAMMLGNGCEDFAHRTMRADAVLAARGGLHRSGEHPHQEFARHFLRQAQIAKGPARAHRHTGRAPCPACVRPQQKRPATRRRVPRAPVAASARPRSVSRKRARRAAPRLHLPQKAAPQAWHGGVGVGRMVEGSDDGSVGPGSPARGRNQGTREGVVKTPI